MNLESVTFETPENVEISYRPAGLGSRFLAWLLDNIVLWVVLIAITLTLICTGIIGESLLKSFDAPKDNADSPEPMQVIWYMVGLFALINGFGSFVYFFLYELFARGQTWGKRCMELRVVKANGFSLDPTSILVRNVFRVIDNLPVVWIVPVVTKKSQRLGDLVAGTIVVADRVENLNVVRSTLSARTAVDARFRFDASALRRARPQDVEAVERVLERWHALTPAERDEFAAQLAEPLARRLDVDPPPEAERLRFLEDFLAATYRLQHRALG